MKRFYNVFEDDFAKKCIDYSAYILAGLVFIQVLIGLVR